VFRSDAVAGEWDGFDLDEGSRRHTVVQVRQ
jgi:hypothetical protein